MDIPVPQLSPEPIASIVPNKFGCFFPVAKHPSKPVRHGTLTAAFVLTPDSGIIPGVTNRDLGRTWKTSWPEKPTPKPHASGRKLKKTLDGAISGKAP